MNRRRQLWWLIFLTAGAAIPQYVMQSALVAPDGIAGLPDWFWTVDKGMWALRALIEPWVIVYLFTTMTKTVTQKIMQSFLLVIELGLLVLIVVTVGPSIAAARLGTSPEPFMGVPWDWMLAAYTSLMVAGAGFAYRVQPTDYEEREELTVDEDQIAELEAELGRALAQEQENRRQSDMAYAELALIRDAMQQVSTFAVLSPPAQVRLIAQVRGDDGPTNAELARLFEVHPGTVGRWIGNGE